jgi:hypothetical protein
MHDVERLFAGDEASVQRAYALSGAFVRELLDRYGTSISRRVLSRIGEGASFEDAFEELTGSPIGVEEWTFWRRQRSLEWWLPVLTSSAVLWAGISLLAIIAIRKRRREKAERLRQMAEEEAAATERNEDPAGQEPDDQ